MSFTYAWLNMDQNWLRKLAHAHHFRTTDWSRNWKSSVVYYPQSMGMVN